ncbi:MAG: hypothetical protein ACYCSN_13885 [Acidobacteriaceae bacterium]
MRELSKRLRLDETFGQRAYAFLVEFAKQQDAPFSAIHGGEQRRRYGHGSPTLGWECTA